MQEKGYRPVKGAESLSFGTLVHECLAAYFSGTQEKIPGIIAKEPDQYRQVIARELVDGYMLRWPLDRSAVLAVEAEFTLPMVNPRTSAYSRTWELAGKIDAIIQTDKGVAVVEHKTTVEDISVPESPYFLKLVIDPQITGYCLGAEKLGHKPTHILYDVIGKPGIRPLRATPEDKRKYTKDGRLYANQRDRDETPEEYGDRLRVDIAENQASYFQRKEIVRNEMDIIEYLEDCWSVGKFIMESRNENFWPRRAAQCFNYGQCQFYQVCAGMASLEDESLYRKATKPNEELEVF